MWWIIIPLSLVVLFAMVYGALSGQEDIELIDIFSFYMGLITVILWCFALWGVWFYISERNSERLLFPLVGLIFSIPISLGIRYKKQSDQDWYRKQLERDIKELVYKNKENKKDK